MDQTLKNVFLKPMYRAYEKSQSKRNSKIISDIDFLEMGLKRVMSYNTSGRSFVQLMIDGFNFINLTVDNFFTALRSSRRALLTKEVNENIIENYTSLNKNNPFKGTSELDEYAIYAADGHFIEHASHEKHDNGKSYPVGHIYSINLRSRVMQHLDVLRPEDKKENEIHALQRLGGPVLRMGEPVGRKVIMVYDRAVVDFREWHKWKQGSGVYVITREKSSMALIRCGDLDFDTSNPVNAGIISDQQVGHSHGRLIRRIEYQDPVSGRKYVFITNQMTLAPGIIAYIYKIRWDIEKAFQQFKCNYKEQKAWGKTFEAKSIQANFLCILHNLMLILEDKVEIEENITDKKIIEKQMKRIIENSKIVEKKKLEINPMILTLKKSIMRSCQFIRLINIAFDKSTSWPCFIEQLRPRMEVYL